MRAATFRGLVLGTSLLLAGAVSAAEGGGGGSTPAKPWRDSYTTRLEALALLQSLNADLLSHDSATLTLDRWCGTHRLAEPAKIRRRARARRGEGADPDQREILGVSATEPLHYRRVRLEVRIARALGSGQLVRAVAPHTGDESAAGDERHRVRSRRAGARSSAAVRCPQSCSGRLYRRGGTWVAPSCEGRKPLESALYVIQHKAVLTLPDGTPFSEVVETYTAEVLAFPGAGRPKAVSCRLIDT